MNKKDKRIIKKGLKKNYIVCCVNWCYHSIDYFQLNEKKLIEDFINIISYINDDDLKRKKIEDYKKAIKRDLNNYTIKSCWYMSYNMDLILNPIL